MKPIWVIPVSALLGLAACAAPQKSLTITTVPEGAVLFELGTGQRYVAPVTVYYDLDERFVDSRGCFHAQPFIAIWASGTTLNPPAGPILLCGDRDDWVMTVHRPVDAPGLDRDLAAAEARQRQLQIEALDREIRRLDGQAALAAGMESLAYGLTCAAGGGCSRGDTYVYGTAPSYRARPFDTSSSPDRPAYREFKAPADSPRVGPLMQQRRPDNWTTAPGGPATGPSLGCDFDDCGLR